ncbi:patatin-like phospholipase family protein [Ramlibacter sp. AN1015]|uniref:patatin-like phospholipase family protein n=1 Tax=Ramlibacter sp. AN1015 TaxID=3133428 RepID=UPI0030C539D3
MSLTKLDGADTGFAAGAFARPTPGGLGGPARCIGLVLGAGSFRGAAHVGVIRALERQGIPIDLVVGTSAGALAGMMYAAGFTADYMDAALRRLRLEDVFTRTPGQDGFTDMRPLQGIIGSLLGADRRIPSLPRAFACVAADALSGRPVILSDGDVATAVEASMAVPGLVRPVRHEGRLLVDGSVVAPVPVSVARSLGADLVIAVAVDVPRHGQQVARHPAESLTHCFDMAIHQLGELELAQADVVIRPDIARFEQSLDRTGEFLAAGERAGDEAAARLRTQLAVRLATQH